jgi:hypothetical protein
MATKRAADGRFVSRTSRGDSAGRSDRSERSRSTRSRTERRGDGLTVRVPDVGHDRTRHVTVHHRPEGALERPHRQEKISRADRSQDARNLDRR